MNFQKNNLLATITLILILAGSAILASSPMATAHTPPINIPTYFYMSAAPSTQQVGQPVLLLVWLDKYPPTANGQYGDRWEGWTIAVTAPDGSKQTLQLQQSDPVGSTYNTFTPTQVGTYTFVANFPGQVLANANPNPAGYGGLSENPLDYVGDTYMASTSDPVSLVVQQGAIPQWNVSPLPTGYWSRPINAQNREWQAVASDWLSGSGEPNSWQRYGTAPNSPHVVWTKPLTFGGIADGRLGDIPYYDGLSYEGFLAPPIIMNGRFYYNTAVPPEYGFTCLDLQTGQQIWYQNSSGPSQLGFGFLKQNYPQLSFGQLLKYDSPNQFGVIPYLWSTYTVPTANPFVSLNEWAMYDAFSGNWICTISGVPTGSAFFGASTQVNDPDGSIIIYDTSTPGYLAVWNSTQCIQDTFPSNNAIMAANGYWMWRPPLGVTIDAKGGYTLNVTMPSAIPPSAGVSGIDNENQIMLFSTGLPSLGIWSPTANSYWQGAISLKTGQVGQLLWTKTRPWPSGNLTLAVGALGSGVYAMYYKETRQWVGYSLTTGDELWGPTASQDVWDVYVLSWNPAVIADGLLLSGSYGGRIYAYDINTGTLKWTYYAGNGPGDDLPYGHYVVSVAAVADSKVFVYNSEHSPNKPAWRGSALRALDISNGHEIWKIDDWAGLGGFGGGAVIADGYLITTNNYDNQIYCYGKGQTTTEVSASPSVVGSGGSVLIQGKIKDLSPAAKNNPAVVPDQYMEAWMEYLVEQQALPSLPSGGVGVPVTLMATKSDGTTVSIGTVNADCEGNFNYVWSPPSNDAFEIAAIFSGTNSYFSSYGSTSVAAVASGSTATTGWSTVDIIIIIAVIIAIIIGIINILAISRMRK